MQPNMKVDILFIDLDGTLLGPDKKISGLDAQALQRCHAEGMKIGYITSRTRRRIRELLGDLPCDFIACYNGADISADSRRYLDGIPHQVGCSILEDVRYISNDVSAFSGDLCLWNGEMSTMDGAPAGENFSAGSACIQRIRIYGCEKGLAGELEKRYGSVCRFTWEGNDLLIESGQVNKGTAVRQILRIFGIPRENALSFGNGRDDIAMFRETGYAVAMADTEFSVRANADETTVACDESGVGRFLDSYVSGGHMDCAEKRVFGTLRDDCIYQICDIRGRIDISSPEEKKASLRQGLPGHGLLARDVPVTTEQRELFFRLLDEYAERTAAIVGVLSESVRAEKGEGLVLVSLARGGIAYGVLARRYLRRFYGMDVPHYAVSLARDAGIDKAALRSIVSRHGDRGIQFVDGWTGSGLVSQKLRVFIWEFNRENQTAVDDRLAVAVDTSKICRLSGTREDVLLPDCCLNATVCGLLSSICLLPSGGDKIHGAVIWEDLKGEDLSCLYRDRISGAFQRQKARMWSEDVNYSELISGRVRSALGLSASQRIRLGIGETTRALYRTDVKRILVRDPDDRELRFIRSLATEKGIELQPFDIGDYSCVSLL